MRNDVRIGDLVVGAGTKKHGYVNISDLQGYLLRLPLMVNNGFKDGPTLCLVAGVHACEYCGIETTMRLFRRIDPQELSGVVIAVPIFNIPAFQAKTAYVNPLDGVDLSKAFPGNPEGSVSYIMADILYRQVVSKADYLINYHGGDVPEENINFVIVEEVGNEEVDKASTILGKCFSPDYMWIKGRMPKATRGLQLKGGLCAVANRSGIPGVMPEAGHSGKVQESAVDFLLNGTLNVMKYLKMLDGSPVIGEPKNFYAQHLVKAKTAGFFRPTKNLGDEVSAGENIGQIRNIFGEVIEEITSPVDGVFDFLLFHASVLPGNVLMIIGEF
jgi:predicted deacylase